MSYSREMLIHIAKVHIAEAKRRRHQRGFHATLLKWAANARRRAHNARFENLPLFAAAE